MPCLKEAVDGGYAGHAGGENGVQQKHESLVDVRWELLINHCLPFAVSVSIASRALPPCVRACH